MANPTRKMIEVYEMLKDGKPFKFDTLVSRLGCKPVTAMVLICALKRDLFSCNRTLHQIMVGLFDGICINKDLSITGQRKEQNQQESHLTK